MFLISACCRSIIQLDMYELIQNGVDCLKPLCKKEDALNIINIIVLLLEIPLYIIFILKMSSDVLWVVTVLSFTALIMLQAIVMVYWISQPNVLIYQYDQGIVINRNVEIEYKSIERIYRKNYLLKKRRGNYYRTPYAGTIYIKLKSGKLYRIRNAYYPIDVVDTLSKMKQQKKFR